MNTCAFSRGDSIGTVLLVSRMQHQIEVQPEKAQAITLQYVGAITPQQVIKPRVVLAEGGGATACVLLEG